MDEEDFVWAPDGLGPPMGKPSFHCSNICSGFRWPEPSKGGGCGKLGEQGKKQQGRQSVMAGQGQQRERGWVVIRSAIEREKK